MALDSNSSQPSRPQSQGSEPRRADLANTRIAKPATASSLAGETIADPARHPLVAAIPERLPHKPLTLGYQLALGVVAVVMMLLPLAYLAIIAGIGWGVFWHLQNNQDIMTAPGAKGRGALLLILIYFAPAIIGGAVVIVMLKPLFSRSPRSRLPPPLSPDDEPVLFAAVHRLCQALGSPTPHRVYLDNHANASASFQSLGDLLLNRLTLVIGLPLVAGMPARNLLGVLAHEFGHFNQYWAMRLGWIIHAINHWFTRVAQERDSWDEWLEQSSKAVDIRLGWVLFLARAGIWLTRQILKGLRWIGVIVSRRLSRQMEYDADACEVALVGSAAFAQSMQQIVELSVASNLADEELNHMARERRLVDNIPRLIAAQARYLPDSVREQIGKTELETTESWDDTHPPNRLRIEHAESLQQQSHYAHEGPATDLFVDFDRCCQLMARELYSDSLKRTVTAEEMVPVDRAIAEIAQAAANDQASLDFVGGEASALNLLVVDSGPLLTTRSAAELWSDLQSARQEQDRYLVPFRESTQRESELTIAWQKAELLSLAFLLKQPTSDFQPANAPRRLRSLDATLEHLTEVLENRNAATTRGLPFRRAWGSRLKAALQLLDTPETEALLPETHRLRAQRDRLWPGLMVLSDTWPAREQIEIKCTNLGYVFSRVMKQGFDSSFAEGIGTLKDSLMKLLEEVWSQLSQAQYPEPVDPPPDHLAAFCLPGIQDPNDPLQVYQGCDRLTSTARIVWRKSLGQAIAIAREVEQVWERSRPAQVPPPPTAEPGDTTTGPS